jgi:hypothetical protein
VPVSARRDPKSLPIRAWLAWKSAGGLIDETRDLPADDAMLWPPDSGTRLMADPPDERLELENDRLEPENDRPAPANERPGLEIDRPPPASVRLILA